ncbi:MAG: methyl-accepting chemotaxis protein [Candidatus Omnitrophota bacterium]
MENIRDRRRNYYITKQFQRGFIIKFCALVILGSAISSAIIYLASRSTVCTTFENSKLVMKSTADFILPAVILSSLVSVMLIGMATIIITLFTSHKIAGPLYRLDKDVQEITAGNLKIIFRLRVGDEIKPLAVSLNDMVTAIRGHIAAAKKGLSSLESSAGLTAEGKEKVRSIRDTLDKFKI